MVGGQRLRMFCPVANRMKTEYSKHDRKMHSIRCLAGRRAELHVCDRQASYVSIIIIRRGAVPSGLFFATPEKPASNTVVGQGHERLIHTEPGRKENFSI